VLGRAHLLPPASWIDVALRRPPPRRGRRVRARAEPRLDLGRIHLATAPVAPALPPGCPSRSDQPGPLSTHPLVEADALDFMPLEVTVQRLEPGFHFGQPRDSRSTWVVASAASRWGVGGGRARHRPFNAQPRAPVAGPAPRLHPQPRNAASAAASSASVACNSRGGAAPARCRPVHFLWRAASSSARPLQRPPPAAVGPARNTRCAVGPSQARPPPWPPSRTSWPASSARNPRGPPGRLPAGLLEGWPSPADRSGNARHIAPAAPGCACSCQRRIALYGGGIAHQHGVQPLAHTTCSASTASRGSHEVDSGPITRRRTAPLH